MASETRRPSMDIMDLEHTSQAEIDAALVEAWQFRQPLYNVYATSLLLDYAPDFAKVGRWADAMQLWDGGQADVMMLAVQNMESYMMEGWETGIRNTFHTLNRNGLTKQQIMEVVMFCQLYSGMRGLGHVYHAAGDMLAVLREPPVPVLWPEGWGPDPEAFGAGLDMTTRELTEQDRERLEAWWERTIGYVPNSYRFAMKYHPDFTKANRARWERALKTVPKQFAPYLMLRHHTTTGWRDGLRESVLLAKAWGMTPHWILKGIAGSAFFCTGMEGLYAAYDAVEDLL